MKEKQAVTREHKPRYHKATKKGKQALLNELIRLTRHHRTSAVRLLAAKPPQAVLVYSNGRPVKLKPEQKRPANRRERVSAPMRLSTASVWSGPFSGIHAVGIFGSQILVPLMRQQMFFIAQCPAFGIAPEIAENSVD
jgi:hypothetical protein